LASDRACLRPFRPCGNDRAPLRLHRVQLRGSPARCRSSVVEHFIGNEEVLSSILSGSTSSRLIDRAFIAATSSTTGPARFLRRALGYGRVQLLPAAVLLEPRAAGLALGSGTAMAMAAGVGLTVAALGSATMVSPTLNCPLVSPARTKDQGSRHRTKANLHIFLLPARHQPSDFATVVCRDGTAVPSVRSAVAIQPSAARMRPAGLCDACGSRKC
jgi:hypothetical protein